MDFLTKLKNKVKYSINQLVDDPDAQKYAEDILKEEKEKEKEKQKNKKDTFTTDTDTESTSDADTSNASNASNASNMSLTQVLGADDAPSWVKSLLYVIQYLLIPLPIAMFIANEMIMYSMPIRLIFFVLTFTICVISAPIAAAFVLYYLLRALYSYYNNNHTENPKISWRPKIFAMVPITVYSSDSILKKLFWRIFSYGNRDNDDAELKVIMDGYLASVNESFPYFEKLKGQPEFKKNYDEITKYINTVHAAPVIPDANANASANANANANENNHLPPVIKPKSVNTTKGTESPKETPLPPVITPKQTIQSNQANNPLPPIITPKNAPEIVPNEPNDNLPPVIARPNEPNAKLKEPNSQPKEPNGQPKEPNGQPKEPNGQPKEPNGQQKAV